MGYFIGNNFFFNSVQHPDCLGAHTASCQYWNRGIFIRGWSGWSVKLDIYTHLVSRLRIYGAIPPLPYANNGVVQCFSTSFNNVLILKGGLKYLKCLKACETQFPCADSASCYPRNLRRHVAMQCRCFSDTTHNTVHFNKLLGSSKWWIGRDVEGRGRGFICCISLSW